MGISKWDTTSLDLDSYGAVSQMRSTPVLTLALQIYTSYLQRALKFINPANRPYRLHGLGFRI